MTTTKTTKDTVLYNNCVIKDGIVKPSDFPLIVRAFLNYEFPDGAINETYSTAMAKNIKGYNAQHIINALNDVIGPNCWREYGKMESYVPQGKSATVSIYEGVFEIGNWQSQTIKRIERKYNEDGKITEDIETNEKVPYFEVLLRFSTYGGSRNLDKWESLKGAKTNFLKKVCSYISNGWKSYALDLDEDFANQSVKDIATTQIEQKKPFFNDPDFQKIKDQMVQALKDGATVEQIIEKLENKYILSKMMKQKILDLSN